MTILYIPLTEFIASCRVCIIQGPGKLGETVLFWEIREISGNLLNPWECLENINDMESLHYIVCRMDVAWFPCAYIVVIALQFDIPDRKLRWPHVGPTWILPAPRWANVGPTCLAIWDIALLLGFVSWLVFILSKLYSYLLLLIFIFYPRPVLAFGYCRCLRLSVCVSVRVSITSLSAR